MFVSQRTYFLFPLVIVVVNVFILMRMSGNKETREKVVVVRECPLEVKKVHSLFSNITSVQQVNIGRGKASEICLGKRPIDDVKMFRDLYDSEKRETMFSSSISSDSGLEERTVIEQQPGDLPGTAHIVWCGEKVFTFADYLSVLSAIRILEPQKLIFHFNFMPPPDGWMYNMWFQELKQSLPNLVLRGTDRKLECNTFDAVRYGLEQIDTRPDGGVYIGEKTLLTHIPTTWSSLEKASYFGNSDKLHNYQHGIMYSSRGGNIQSLNVQEFTQKILSKTFSCVTEEEFERGVDSQLAPQDSSPTILPPCVVLTKDIHPEDIINSTSRLAELARWLYYGKSARITVKPGPDREEDLIPNVCHMICIRHNPGESINWPFNAYLSVLSALHVAGFKKVYIHGNVKIEGEWWERLKRENITFVELDRVETVFQTAVNVIPHNTDIIRTAILMKYGGVYMDWDIIWANRIPRSIRRYPAVFSYDWPKYGDWPGAFNLGVLMAKPKALFLRKFVDSFRYYRDDLWQLNAMLMPYKIWERHPDLMHVNTHLQVICFMGICHPTWEKDYIRDINDKRPTIPFTIDEPLSFHFTEPDYPPSMESLATIKEGTDMMAEVGRRILDRSGHSSYPQNIQH